MERKTTSKEELYLKQQQLQEFGRVKSHAPLVSRLVDEHEKVANLNLSVSGKNTISLAGVDTFGKGRWMKFDIDKYKKNAQELKALVENDVFELRKGDYYIFMDNEGKPHIAVYIIGNTVKRVYGIKGSFFTVNLAEKYLDVVIEFLTKNPNAKDSDKWLKIEELEARLIEYKKQIESGKTDEIDIGSLMADYYETFAYHRYFNTEILSKLRPQLAKHLKCKPEEIDYGADFKGKCKQPYVIVLRNVDFEDSQITNLGKLQTIGGNANFENSQITSLGNLQMIGGYANFIDSQITDLGKLQLIGGNANFENSQITSLGKLQTIGGNAYFENSKITNLGNLQLIGGYAWFRDSQITSLGKLQTIGENAYFENSQITSLGNLQTIGGDAWFCDSQITSLGKLQTIGGDANFQNSKITSLGNLQTIERSAYFGGAGYSQITDFGNLQTIGGGVFIENDIKLKKLFLSQFEKDGKGWKRKLTAKVEQEKPTNDDKQKKSKIKTEKENMTHNDILEK